MCMLHTYTYMTYMCVFSFKQMQVFKYMQSKIVGDIAHVLKSSVTVDSARMKTLIHFCIMKYPSWQFLAHCHPNTDLKNPYLYVTDDIQKDFSDHLKITKRENHRYYGDEVIIMCGKRLFYEVFYFLNS
nr:uncharacterized protein LOC124814397 isoform X1 [Hydra vulgaris]